MARTTVELDFFGIERDQSSSISQFQKFQSAISKINPEVLKSVIANRKLDINGVPFEDSKKSFSVPSSPKSDKTLFPVCLFLATSENLPETTPLTIFYNGSVSVFDVPRDKAENILKIAIEGSNNVIESTTVDPNPTPPLSTTKHTSLILSMEICRLHVGNRCRDFWKNAKKG
ncbi:hypothetical protein F8388_006002 [Cannabis sativa]|uniref:Protein TIFY n=1 Tax=Cannabis sativa TaxID=3483 RepID=A0A7J6H5W8_CANSA|nr:hypothetical protein F8388_006002 [Cannabis sativa]